MRAAFNQKPPVLVFLLWMVLVPDTAVRAQPAPDAGQPGSHPATSEVPGEGAELVGRAATPVEQAAQIDALLRGELDPRIDARSLFVVDLRSLSGEEGGTRDELAEARQRFLDLPAEERVSALEAHTARRAEYEAIQSRLASLRAERERLTTVADQLEAYLDGRLELSVDPAALLTVNLLEANLEASDEGAEATGEGAASNTAIEERPDTDPPSEEDTLRAEVDALTIRVRALRQRFVTLSPEARVELQAQHHARRDQATEARAEAERSAERASAARLEAEAAARLARTEAERVVADERARLLQLSEAQARQSVRMAETQGQLDQLRDDALGWLRRVRELTQRSILDVGRDRDADRLYDALVEALTQTRVAFRKALSELGEEAPVPDPGEPRALPDGVNVEGMDALHQQVRTEAEALRQEARRLGWLRASTLRDAMVQMNQSRLVLLEHVSAEKRAALKGFGRDGIEQASREVEQMMLEARFHVLHLPRAFDAWLAELRASPVAVIFSVLQLVVILIFFRAWRKRADGVLDAAHEHYRERMPRSVATKALSVLFWYLRQVRSPLEWLALAFLFSTYVLDLGDTAELQYLWIVVSWVLFGSLAISLVHAIVARQAAGDDKTEKLRIRSLRLVGATIIVVGLLLSLAHASVGKGAVFNWVLNSCWMLAIPIAVLLVIWWRPVVLTRAKEKHNPSKLIQWVVRNSDGAASYPAAAVGGCYLLFDGLRRFALRQVAHIAVVQRVFAYLFRREVERQAELRGSAITYEPLRPEVSQKLRPEAEGAPIVQSVMHDALTRAATLIDATRSAAIAVVGEHGIGKSTFMRRLVSEYDEDDIVWLSCRPGGFAQVVRQLAAAVGLPEGATQEEVIDRLQERAPKVVVLDDAHRLVRPLIGGLKDIDDMVELARRVSAVTDWLFSLDTPAWHYLNRARGGRVIFDEVVQLPQWTETEVLSLVQSRAAFAEIELNFDDLLVPRQVDAPGYGAETDDTERDFIRILWDYARGNPSVALHFFEASLGHRDGQTFVRLFKRPALTELENLPSNMYFVLRAVVQMGLASEQDVVSCTHLHPAEVADALRSARARGLVDSIGGRVAISLEWFRAVTSVLQRQHLLLETL